LKILLAIDGSDASANAVRFVAELLGRAASKDDSVTLYHVAVTLPDTLLSPGIPQPLGKAYDDVIKDVTARCTAEGKRLLEQQAQVLRTAGIPGERIATRLELQPTRPESSKVAAALAIIDEMNKGDYQVVCVGRRGAASARGTFPASMAEKILQQSRGKTVWVVD
jgi:nucleotide-binding universal stress UspA family protein